MAAWRISRAERAPVESAAAKATVGASRKDRARPPVAPIEQPLRGRRVEARQRRVGVGGGGEAVVGERVLAVAHVLSQRRARRLLGA